MRYAIRCICFSKLELTEEAGLPCSCLCVPIEEACFLSILLSSRVRIQSPMRRAFLLPLMRCLGPQIAFFSPVSFFHTYQTTVVNGRIFELLMRLAEYNADDISRHCLNRCSTPVVSLAPSFKARQNNSVLVQSALRSPSLLTFFRKQLRNTLLHVTTRQLYG